MVLPQFDETQEFQTFHDVDGVQIIMINTDNVNHYLDKVKAFFEENKPYIDKNGHTKVIQVYLKIPPLSAILSYMGMEIPEAFKWTAVAIVEPELKALDRFKPTIEMVVNALLTTSKNRYALKIFDRDVLNNPEIITQWLDKKLSEEIAKGSVE